MSRHTEVEAARELLLGQRSAALATLSCKLGGHPFVSSVDYLADEKASVLILISQLAEHTKNIQADARVSLLIQSSPDNVQASPRLTLTGNAEAVPESAREAEKQRYLTCFPDAAAYFQLDFVLYRIQPLQLRYVGGPGVARWIAPGDFSA
jgi:hypothetical protein